MTTGGVPVNAGATASAAAAAAAARMARATSAAASAGLSNAQAIQMQMNQQASAATQLQQRAAAAAQYLNSGQRKATSRDVQTMLEKNDAALRAWSYLHAQQPPKHLVPEHKAWAHKCLALRQQIGARLEVLASLADKQVAQEDSNGKTTQVGQPPAAASNSLAAKKTSVARSKVPSKPTIKTESPSLPHTHAQATQAQVLAQQARQTQPAPANAAPPMLSAGMTFPAQTLPITSQGSATSNPAGMLYNSNATATATISFPSSGIASNAAPIATTSTMPTASSTQGFNPQAYATSVVFTPQSAQSTFMNQANPANFLVGNAMSMPTTGMVNPQFIGMQMPGQMPVAMSSGAMYDPSMFASSGYMGMSANHLPADPFNASFQMQPAAGFSAPYGMVGNAQMMGAMGGMMPMQNAQMMMNPMAFNMGVTQQQQIQQYQAPGFSTSSQPQQLQQPQMQQQQPQASQPSAQLQSLQVSTTFSDDDSNLFDGLGDDAFLNME